MREFKTGLVLGLLALAGIFACRFGPSLPQAQAGMPVIDPVNLVQNVLQVQESYVSTANQIQQIQYQAQSLQDLSFDNYQDAIFQMRRAQGILQTFCINSDLVPGRIGYGSAFNPLTCGQLIPRVNLAYPQDWSRHRGPDINEIVSEWINSNRDAAVDTMNAQNEAVANMEENAKRMEELAVENQGAPGEKAAAQVGNQMLATMSSQLQDMHATQIAAERQRALKAAEEESLKKLSRQKQDEFFEGRSGSTYKGKWRAF